MRDQPGGPSKKKKAPKIDYEKLGAAERAKKAEIEKPKKASKSRGQAAFRGGSRGGKTLEDFKKAKAKRDAAKAPASSKPKGKSKVVTKPKKDKAIRKIKKKREKTNPPAPAKTAVKTEPSKTYSVTNLTGFQNQEQELLNAYIAMAGTELFQYINSQTIDGAYNDVAIINVLSRRRQQYTPNRLIELAQVYVKAMWIENGELCIQIEDPDDKWDRCVLSLLVGTSSSIIAKTVN
jgi:hypothetical protein